MIMKKIHLAILLTMLLSMFCPKALAQDIAVENADGVMIYYNYINNGTELEVAKGSYSGTVVIPEEVTYMNRTRKVTSIGYRAFSDCRSLTSVTIPNSVTSIGNAAFYGCTGLTSPVYNSTLFAYLPTSYSGSYSIPDGIKEICGFAIYDCKGLTSITIPNSVTSIGYSAFQGCTGLTSVTIPNSVTTIGSSAFYECTGLTSITIPNSVTSIDGSAFYGCTSLTSVTIPNSVTSIGNSAFSGCTGLTSVTIGNSVTSIGERAFYGCSSLTSVTIPNSVTSIGNQAFYGADITSVVSLIENPFVIISVFNANTYYNATLYVPVGTIEKYKATQGWKDFLFIEEVTGGGGVTPTPQKCEKPTISYSKGKLTFHSATEGAVCQSTITDADITSYSSNEVELGVTYLISVYATKEGYEHSETATATLCWIDVEPKTEGIENGIASIRANAVLIQSANGRFSISGVDEGTAVIVYNTAGQEVGSGKANAGVSEISTTLRKGEIGIIKIGEKAVKAMMR